MDFLPEVKMDFIPSDNESDIEDNVKEDIQDFDDEKDINVEEDKVAIVVPKAKSKREDMNVNDIFNMDGVIINDPNVKLTKKGKPRKARPPMSEEHKEKLKLAREKAMASRKAKAQERKENKQLEKEEKELLKKQKVKRVQKLKEEVEEDVPPTITKKEPSFTKKDLEEAQLQAIMNYEKIRKSRKEEKKERMKKEAEEEALKNQIRRAVAPPKEYNPFNGCY
jgi:hypothetical protein